MSTARVGCSGGVYKHWRGPVYPPDLPARRWFEHYATSWLGAGHDVYAYFNNDGSGFAGEDARWLADRLEHRNS